MLMNEVLMTNALAYVCEQSYLGSFQPARADTHVPRRPHAPFLLVSNLGHLRIKREKRDTCPIRSFLPRLNHFGDGFYTRTEKRARDPRSTTAPAAASKWPATQMSPSRSQVKACGSRPRATVATFANSHLGVARISCIPPSHARLCYGGVQPWEAAKCRSIRLGFTKFNSVSH